MKRGDKGIYVLEGGRQRYAFALRSYTKHLTTTKLVKVIEKEESEGADGEIVTREIEHEIEKEVTRTLELVDLVVLLEPEDEKKGATRAQVLTGYLTLEAVQVGEGVDRFSPEA